MTNNRGRIPLAQLQELLRSAAPPPSSGRVMSDESFSLPDVYRDANLRPVSGNERIDDEYFNPIQFFSFSNARDITEGSQQVLAINTRRQYLSVENQSADKDIYVNFGGDANVGQGILIPPRTFRQWDQKVPRNSVHVFVNDAGKQTYVVVEGSPILKGVA